MKKIIIILGTLLLAFLILYYLISDTGSLHRNKAKLKKEVQVNERESQVTEKSVQDSRRAVTEKVDANINEKESNIGCHQRYQQHENWQRVNDIFAEVYINDAELSGEHHFQEMQLEAVKSYADAGDPNAMFHYGSELIWKGGLGIYFNELNRSGSLSQSERKKAIDNHQLDMMALEYGSKYLLDSATLGKLGGIIELQLLHHHIFKRQVEHGKDIESIKNAMMLSLAYEQLIEEVFINDSLMMDGFQFTDEKKNLMKKLSKQYPEIELAEIQEEANNIQGRLFNYWREKREKLGKPIYPNKFPDYLEQHMANKNKECQT